MGASISKKIIYSIEGIKLNKNVMCKYKKNCKKLSLMFICSMFLHQNRYNFYIIYRYVLTNHIDHINY